MVRKPGSLNVVVEPDHSIGMRVARLRLIFKVSEVYERALFGDDSPGALAFIEWFTPPPRQTDPVNGMHMVTRCRNIQGEPECAIVELVDVRRACHLMPKFGRQDVARAITSESILDNFDDFFLNKWIDKDMYRSMYWNEAESDDE